ncbi:MAG: ATP-binding protein, partial [Deltaproteobacteria bacterium]|nr:ATP-binding protein [Deltaproteobacteria bacterium]
ESTYENFINAIHPGDRDMVVAAVGGCVERKEKYDIEHRVVWPDGSIRWLSEKGNVYRDKDDRPIKMLGVVQDVTSRRELDEELILATQAAQEGARAKSVFLANMSHEIRTPMNSVVGFSDVLLETRLDDKQREYLNIVSSSARSLLSLLNDILDVSKMESNKVELEHIPYHLPRAMKEALQLLNIKAQEKSLSLELDIHRELYHCFIGDPARLRQILLNLVGNAIKFTEKGSVKVSVQPEGGDMLRFTVMDSGIGMTPQQLEGIFQPFAQAEESTTRRFGGTGLGTTISKQLVELMGGRIWVESELGKGSSFIFTIRAPFPDCAEHCPSSCMAHGETGDIIRPESKRRFRILLAEDIEENIALARIRLEEQGHELTVVRNGLDALEEFSPDRFDVILMDVQMPIMDGLQATRKIREREKGTRAPIIAMTASVLREDKELCLDAGMDAVESKPVVFSSLFRTMEELVPAGRGRSVESTVVKLEKFRPFDMPQINGVNTERGLRAWHDPRVYLVSLKSFAIDYADFRERLAALLETGDYQGAGSLLHALKGLAGNLSIEQIGKISGDMESHLKNGDIQAFESLQEHLFQNLAEVLEAIGRVPEMEQQQGEPHREFNPETVKGVLRKILEGLEEDDPGIVEPFVNELEEYVPREKIRVLRKKIDEFDFDQAKVKALEMMNKIAGNGAL